MSRLPVGSSAKHDRRPRRRSRARSRPAAARRPTAGSGRWASRWASPTRTSASCARSPPLGQAARPRRAGRRRRCRARTDRRAGRTAGRRSRSRSPAARRATRSERPAASCPAIRTRPAVGRSSVPITCSSVDLPEPDGPTIASELALLDRERDALEGRHVRPVALLERPGLEDGAHAGTTTRAPSSIPRPVTST